MKKLTKCILGTGLSLALFLGSGKLFINSYRNLARYEGVQNKVVEKNPDTKKMYNLRHDLFFYFADKDYSKLDNNPSEIASMSQEYAILVSDEGNKRDFDNYLKLDEKLRGNIWGCTFGFC